MLNSSTETAFLQFFFIISNAFTRKNVVAIMRRSDTNIGHTSIKIYILSCLIVAGWFATFFLNDKCLSPQKTRLFYMTPSQCDLLQREHAFEMINCPVHSIQQETGINIYACRWRRCIFLQLDGSLSLLSVRSG